MVQVDVTGGVVRLTGELEHQSMLSLIFPLTRPVDGVIDVEGHLSYAIDDTRLPAAADITDY
jgi:osmotically-inducible protein OsmY